MFSQSHFTQRGMRDVRVGIVIFLWAIGLLTPALANPAEKTAERPLSKVIIAYSSISGNMAPLWMTYEKGFFSKYGLNVQLVLVEEEAGPHKPSRQATWPLHRWQALGLSRVTSRARTS